MLYVVIAIGSLIVLSLLWRFASERFSLPLPVFLRGMVEMDNPFAQQNRAAVIVDQLNVKPGMTVLDVGCGPGRLAIPLAEAVGADGRVIAIDMQQGMLHRVREKADAKQLRNIIYMKVAMGTGRLREILAVEQAAEPSAERSVQSHPADGPVDTTSIRADRAVLVTVLGEIPEREAALAEIFEALKPGGILSVTETIFDPHYQRREAVSEAAQTVGFQEIAVFGNRVGYTVHLRKPDSARANVSPN